MMSSTRIDQVEPHYQEAAFWSRLTKLTFAVSAVTSIVVLLAPRFGWFDVYSASVALYVGSVIVFSALSVIANLHTLPKAEAARRRQLLTDTLGVDLTHEVTQNYYNNKLEPSVLRLGAAVLENSLFGKTVAWKMVRRGRLVMIAYLGAWSTIAAYREFDVDIVVFVTQAIFTSELLFNHAKLETLHHRLSRVYDDLYSLFASRPTSYDKRAEALVICNFAAYEAAKAETGIRQSSKVFHSINARTTREWDGIRQRLGI